MKDQIYLVRYIEDDNLIDGFVYNTEDFDKLLENENKKRNENGEELYQKSEFKLLVCNLLK